MQMDRPNLTPAYPSVWAAERSYDIRELTRIVRRRKSIVIGTVTLILALTVFFLSQLTPTYRAEALVIVEAGRPILLTCEKSSPTSVRTRRRRGMKSRSFAHEPSPAV